MVRLKVYTSNGAGSSQIISIPYGAIKRGNFSLMGSLKTRFQFLMVRLKADDEIRIYADYYISIPYGAIKR